MRQWGCKKYRAGAVWEVDRPERPFHFQILGIGQTPKSRNCAVVHKFTWDSHHNSVGEYTIKHLKKYAVCIKEGE